MATAKTKTEEVKVVVPLKGVYAKLQAARIALMEKGLKKTGKNTFANFDFFQLVDFLPEVQKIFTKLGLTTNYTLAPRVVAEETVMNLEDTKLVSSKPIIRDMARLIIRDLETGEETTFEMEAEKLQIGNNTKQNNYQAAGGRSTYYKRYLYRDALEIEESDESDIMLGAPEVNYQEAEVVAPPEIILAPAGAPQATTIQENIIQPQENTTPKKKVKEEVAGPDDVLSQESREEVMAAITAKGLQPFEELSAYCAQNGIAAPNELKEKDKASLLAFIESK